MMSSTLCAYWPFGYPLLWNAHPGLLPTFYLSFTYRFLGIIYIFYIQVLCWIYAWQISSLKDLLFIILIWWSQIYQLFHLWIMLFISYLRNTALAGVAQWIECWPMNQRVTSSIPSQGICLVGSYGGTQEATTHWCFSPSLSPSLAPCLKTNK